MYKWFQKAADFLGRPTPDWLKKVLSVIQDILFNLLSQAGKAYVRKIEDYIIETQLARSTSTGEDKFQIVTKYAKTLLTEWPDSEIDTLCQNLFIGLKKSFKI